MSSPRMWIVAGCPGAGKSQYARSLAQTHSATLIDIDTVTERLVRVGLLASGRSADDRDSDYFKKTYRQVIYDTLFAIARENLRTTGAVVVGPFTQEIRNPNWLAQLERELGFRPELHYVRCDPHERRERLKERGEARDIQKLENWESFLEYYGREEAPLFPHLLIDTTSSPKK